MDADALEFRYAEQDGKPLLELRTPRDHYSITAFGDGRATFYLIGPMFIIPPSGFERVAEILLLHACQILIINPPLNIKPTYRVGFTFCYTF